MCSQCENCSNCGFIRGSVRGVMDCDPDEWFCKADEDMYFYADDNELVSELMEDGQDEDDVDISCPSFSPGYDMYEDDRSDELYERYRDEQLEKEK